MNLRLLGRSQPKKYIQQRLNVVAIIYLTPSPPKSDIIQLPRNPYFSKILQEPTVQDQKDRTKYGCEVSYQYGSSTERFL